MKKIIKKFWGIALIVTLLASMLVSAVPAAAGTLAWSTTGQPGIPATGNQIAAADANIVRVAPNGDIFVVDNQVVPSKVWKSTNGGKSFAGLSPANVLPAGYVVADLQISPSYTTDSTVLILVNTGAATIVMISTNAGASFAQLGGNISAVATVVGTSLALEPTYMSGVGQIVVATASNIGGTGDIWSWGSNGVLNWINTAFGTGGVSALPAANVDKIAFSPLYPIDATFMAVTSSAGAVGTATVATALRFKIATNAWEANLNSVNINAATNAALVIADIAFPSDFNASIGSARNLYVSTSSAGLDNVYRVTQGSLVGSLPGAPTYLAVGNTLAATDTPVNTIAYKGTYAAGTLYTGLVGSLVVWQSSNANAAAGVIWTPSAASPTGNAVTSNSAVALSGNDIYVGTTGAESAFNVSYDGGVYYYQLSLIDTAIAGITDLALADANLWFLSTTDGTLAGPESLWKSTDGGATWLRVTTMVTGVAGTGLTSMIALSSNFATDKTMYYYEIGGAPAASKIVLSQDGGNTFQPRAYPGGLTTVGQVLAVDQYVLYVADTGAATAAVYKSVNNGWTWVKQAVGSGAVNQIKLDKGTGAVLAGTTNGMAYLSTNGSTWTKQGATVGAGNMVVAFDANYGTNGILYAGQTAAAGIFRQTAGAAGTVPWFNIDGVSLVSTAIADIFVAPDGTLYATDPTATAGMIRALVPTSGAGPVATAPAPALVGGAAFTLTAGSTLSAIDYLPGSNIIYSIDTTGNAVRTFTDTLSTPIPAVVAPANAAILNAAAINVQIETVAGATAYQVQWSMRDDYNPGVNGATEAFLAAPFNSRVLGATTAAANQPLAGSIVYYRVRVSAPVVGPWSQTFMVNTQLTPAGAPNAPVIVVPAIPEGSTAQGGFNVDRTASFFWGVVTGATTYEFQLGTDAGLSNLIVDATGANALGNVTSYTVSSPLDYGKTYYWRVRAKSASSETSWSNVQAFRVMDQPAATTPGGGGTVITPTITFTTQPPATITFTQPAATTTQITIPSAPATTEVGPAYIWAIIIIGAVLVIAVIVLIVRTRRSV